MPKVIYRKTCRSFWSILGFNQADLKNWERISNDSFRCDAEVEWRLLGFHRGLGCAELRGATSCLTSEFDFWSGRRRCASGAIALRAFIVSHAVASCWRKSFTVSRHFFIASACAFTARWCKVSMPNADPRASAASAATPLGGSGALGAGGSLTRSGKVLAALTAP